MKINSASFGNFGAIRWEKLFLLRLLFNRKKLPQLEVPINVDYI